MYHFWKKKKILFRLYMFSNFGGKYDNKKIPPLNFTNFTSFTFIGSLRDARDGK